MKLFLAALVLCFVSYAAFGDPPEPGEKWSAVIIPRVDLTNATAFDAFRFLAGVGNQSPIRESPVCFLLLENSPAHVTLHAEEKPLPWLIQKICEQLDWGCLYTSAAAVVGPKKRVAQFQSVWVEPEVDHRLDGVTFTDLALTDATIGSLARIVSLRLHQAKTTRNLSVAVLSHPNDKFTFIGGEIRPDRLMSLVAAAVGVTRQQIFDLREPTAAEKGKGTGGRGKGP
ncbi:MAG TPA: hypothetical protein VGH90_00975 [Chthoniobacteraceae bacterium]|jgi:hypothetical protein